MKKWLNWVYKGILLLFGDDLVNFNRDNVL